jgi:hypothetical protein
MTSSRSRDWIPDSVCRSLLEDCGITNVLLPRRFNVKLCKAVTVFESPSTHRGKRKPDTKAVSDMRYIASG